VQEKNGASLARTRSPERHGDVSVGDRLSLHALTVLREPIAPSRLWQARAVSVITVSIDSPIGPSVHPNVMAALK
jgi:hypothetical protein